MNDENERHEVSGAVERAPDHAAELGARLSPWRRLRGILGLVGLVGGFYLVANSMMSGGEGTAYFLDVAEVGQRLAQVEGRVARVKGNVIIGSYAFEAEAKTHRFKLEEKGAVLLVAYKGPLPDVFKEGIPVVVEGTVRSDMSMEAREVTAKCPSKYEEGKVSEQAKERM
jgi:cytochrome c-type biogenesis protein CcmE